MSVLPLILLLIGVSTVFFFTNGRGHFYRQASVSSHQLSIVNNFSLATHFIQFEHESLDEFGNLNYSLYGRFPPGGYALIKLATFVFDNNLSTQIYAARILMLMFFAGTLVLAYWSLCRLTSSKWAALSATALAFSSGYFLYYNDLIATEFGIDLFGCMLVFHGMIIFVLESRFRQLVVKSCIALLLGWHVLAVLMPFIVLGLFKEIWFIGSVRIRDYKGAFKRFLTKIRMGVAAAVTGHYMILGIIVAGFSILVLVSNIGHQYYYLNIENDLKAKLFDLPVFESATKRLGGGTEVVLERVQWVPFLKDQFIKIGVMSIPFALPGYSSVPSWWKGNHLISISELQNLFTGIIVVSVCVVVGFFARYRLLTMTAVLSGFCWAIPWRHNVAFHHWEALYYVGLPLVLFALLFTLIRKLSNELFIGSISVVTVLIFGFSSFQMSSVRDNSRFSADFHQTMIDDFNNIRHFTKNSSVLVPVDPAISEVTKFDGAGHGLFHYLSGSTIAFDRLGCNEGDIKYEYNVDFVPDEIDFVIQTRRDMPGLLTPNNHMIYLYDQYVYERAIDRFIEDNEPAYDYNGLNGYLTGDRRLFYIADRCSISNRLLNSQFFLEITPVLISDLPAQRRPYGYDRLDFYYDEHNVLDTKRFILALKLPDYDIASIRAGHLTSDGDLIWEKGDLIWENIVFGSEYAITR